MAATNLQKRKFPTENLETPGSITNTVHGYNGV